MMSVVISLQYSICASGRRVLGILALASDSRRIREQDDKAMLVSPGGEGGA